MVMHRLFFISLVAFAGLAIAVQPAISADGCKSICKKAREGTLSDSEKKEYQECVLENKCVAIPLPNAIIKG